MEAYKKYPTLFHKRLIRFIFETKLYKKLDKVTRYKIIKKQKKLLHGNKWLLTNGTRLK